MIVYISSRYSCYIHDNCLFKKLFMISLGVQLTMNISNVAVVNSHCDPNHFHIGSSEYSAGYAFWAQSDKLTIYFTNSLNLQITIVINQSYYEF